MTSPGFVRGAGLEGVAGIGAGTGVDEVSLTVTVGELTAIVGPSGSGKTTLLHLMGTLDKPTRGTVRIIEVDAAAMTDRELSALRASRIGFVFKIGEGGLPCGCHGGGLRG